MNYGYDAQGNRVTAAGGDDDEDAHVREANPNENEEDNGNTATATAAAHSSDDSGSEFGDDVELVIGETGNQAVSQPLVETVDLSLRGRHRTATKAFLQLEAGGPHGAGAKSPQLLIGDLKGAAAGRKAVTQQSFIDAVARVPSRVQTVALVGSLHHGKSSLLTMLLDGKSYPPRRDEEDRKVSLKAHVVSSLVQGTHLEKMSRLVTFVDTPGHPDFIGEVAAGVRLADVALFCVDALESLDAHGEQLLRHLVLTERLPIVLVITKVERLLLDLKLPPQDTYRKLRLVVEAVNNVVASCGHNGDNSTSKYVVAPENGTVLFSSTKLGFIFSLETFALKYAGMHREGAVDTARLAQRLWGQITYEQPGGFKKLTNFRQRPTFVTFVLEPLYKIVAHAVTGKGAERLSGDLTQLPRSPLSAMQEAVRLFLGRPSGDGMDAILPVLSSATTEARTRTLCEAYGLLQRTSSPIFSLPEHSEHGGTTTTSKVDGVSVAAVAPLVCVFTATAEVAGSSVGKRFKHHRTALVVRVLKGILQSGVSHGSNPSSSASLARPLVAVDELSDDVNPFSEAHIARLFVRLPDKGFVEVEQAHPGQVVYATLHGGEDEEDNHSGKYNKQKTNEEEAAATASSGGSVHTAKHLVLFGGRAADALLAVDATAAEDEEVTAYAGEVEAWVQKVRPWRFTYGHDPIVHVSLELKDPAALPAFQRGLKLLRRTTPGLDLHTEESGEYTMTGFGELHLDTALHQLRTSLCSGLKVGLSQPFVSFSETVLDAEGALAVAGTRKKGTVGCTSGVLPRGLAASAVYERMDFFPSDAAQTVQLWTTLRRDYGFDALDAQHVLALGPDRTKGPSLLIDDTLEEERVPGQPALSTAQRNAVVAGFRDAMRSGPLVGETVRGVGVRLILAEAATDKAARVNETRASARLAVRQSLFGARPRLLEPVLAAEVLCPSECVEKLTSILQQRRGAVLGEFPVAATTLTRVRALVPAMDSFGLETQVRMQTYGQAFPLFSFSQWDVVPGDPYDATIHVGPMEPAKGHQLARDFVLKTRFRKGLPRELTGDI